MGVHPIFTAVLRLFTGRVRVPLRLITGSCYQSPVVGDPLPSLRLSRHVQASS